MIAELGFPYPFHAQVLEEPPAQGQGHAGAVVPAIMMAILAPTASGFYQEQAEFSNVSRYHDARAKGMFSRNSLKVTVA